MVEKSPSYISPVETLMKMLDHPSSGSTALLGVRHTGAGRYPGWGGEEPLLDSAGMTTWDSVLLLWESEIFIGGVVLPGT